MKSVFYKCLIADRMGLSAGERIIYSNLVYNSLCNYEESWNKETGKYDSVNLEYETELPLGISMTSNTIESRNPVSRTTAWRTIKVLAQKGIITDDYNYIRLNNILSKGYFTLQTDSGLKNELLIFYSWLVSVAKDKRMIFCNRERLKTMYHVGIEDIKYYLKRLNQLGLVERDKKNNLIIKQR